MRADPELELVFHAIFRRERMGIGVVADRPLLELIGRPTRPDIPARAPEAPLWERCGDEEIAGHTDEGYEIRTQRWRYLGPWATMRGLELHADAEGRVWL